MTKESSFEQAIIQAAYEKIENGTATPVDRVTVFHHYVDVMLRSMGITNEEWAAMVIMRSSRPLRVYIASAAKRAAFR